MTGTKYIKKVLMCEPDYFQVNYVINPWMKVGSVDTRNAKSQWRSLVKSLQSLDIEVEVIPQQKNLPDMVFAADQAIVKNENLVISNFHYPQRRSEVIYYQSWFEKNNFNIRRLPQNYFFEGSGECVWLGETLFVGTGFRNSPNVCNFLTKLLKSKVTCLELVNPKFYHLDTCLFVLNLTTAFYYPTAFSQKSLKILAGKIPNLVPLTKHEANNFAANSLVTDHHVIIQRGNTNVAQKINEFGYKTVELNLSEFMKSGGGIHCLVQVLKETYAD